MIGIGVASVHGVLVQRLMVRRVDALLRTEGRAPASVQRLIPLLLHFSTFNWLVGGLALIAAALWGGPDTRLAIGLLAGSSYLFGALGNLWGTRGRHPGWLLYAIAVALIAFGLS